MNSAKNFVCKIDKRRFGSASALKQHQSDAHGAGSKPVAKQQKQRARPARGNAGSAPLAFKSSVVVRAVTQETKSQGSVASGSDVLAVLNVSATQKPIILGRFAVNPSLMEDTRLQQVANLWDRWRPLSIKLSVQTTIPSIGGGQMVVSWTSDHDHKMPASGLSRFRAAAAMQPSKIAHLWEKVSITPTLAPQQKWLWVDHQQGADSFYGVFYVILTGTPMAITGTFQVTVTLDWKLAFDTPQLLDIVDDEVIVRADQGYYPYFTTYTSHLPLVDRMTLQENSNGGYSSIVKFSSMQVDTAYQPLTDDQLKYYDAANKEQKVGALVRQKETTEPFVWCFDTVANAQSYISSGTTTFILKCTKAGPWAIGNPDWKEYGVKDIMIDNRISSTIPRPVQSNIRTDPGLKHLVGVLATALQAVVINTNHAGVWPISGIPVLVKDPVPAEAMAASTDMHASGCAARSRMNSWEEVEDGADGGHGKDNPE